MNTKRSPVFSVRETSETHDTTNQADAVRAMLYASEGLNFGHRPSALGLRTLRVSLSTLFLLSIIFTVIIILLNLKHEALNPKKLNIFGFWYSDFGFILNICVTIAFLKIN